MSSVTSGSSARLWALGEVSHRQTRTFSWPVGKDGQPLKVTDFYGSNTFSLEVMKEKLPKPIFRKMLETVKRGQKLDKSIADEVANAVKEWATEKGATHFTHWFQPQTGITAEKHDSFLTFDDEGMPMERFSGSQLIQSEPDASSFPSGGMRTTFEARGYTAWDASSPIFIADGVNGKTLCIPSVFISYYGQALDLKTPLLRSMDVLSKSALSILRLFGNKTASRVVSTLGPEQEYFLIDYAFYAQRPDLVAAGRTLVGAKPPKGQELEDHYFGSIKERIESYMMEVEYELYKLGIPVKTRHNEVAPSQFETAPIFEEASVAADHNQLTMETLKAVARRHDLAMLIHEKPFAGINGSGKHNNWSMQDSEGNNMLEPGKTPIENLQFLVFLMATLKGVHKRSNVLRAAIAGSGNDHRLGANEAPPAIISAFLGEQLTNILNQIETGDMSNKVTEERVIGLGIAQLPEVAQDQTDRNRTSPFAFTGNKFEFRAVASSASVATPITYLNTAVAEALDELAAKIKTGIEQEKDFKQVVIKVIKEAIIETKDIRFEGNGYSEEWVVEAEKRGLPNLRKTPEALAELIKPDVIEFFSKAGVFKPDELESRYHVNLERYIKDVEIEIQSLDEILRTMVLPAAYKHQSLLAESIDNLLEVLDVGKDDPSVSGQVAELKSVAGAIGRLQSGLTALGHKVHTMEETEDAPHKARLVADEVIPAMADLRTISDELEGKVADDLWPLPKYREMLFLS